MVTTPPAAPNRTDPVNFRTRMDAFLAWLVIAVPEFNTLALATGPGLFLNGTAAAPSISFASDTDTGWFRVTTNVIALATQGIEALRVSSIGNVFIGTTTAVVGAGAARVTASGTGADGSISVARFSADITPPFLHLSKSRSPADGAYNIVLAGDDLGGISFRGADGAGTTVQGAAILAEVEGTPAAADIRASLQFMVRGSAGVTETFRLATDETALAKGTGGLGYGVGAGGSVTQITSKATGVTLNTPTGLITTQAASLAAGAAVIFTLTDSKIGINDTLNVSVRSPVDKYRVNVVGITAGTARIELINSTAGALLEAVLINFAVLKGAVT